jgi:hypothetical protein
MPDTTTLPLTRFEMIAAAFPLHAQRIAECVYEHNPSGAMVLRRFLTDPADDFDVKRGAGAILQGAFSWDQTHEGHNYWSALRHGVRP